MKKVCVVTGSRAEYSLLKNLILRLKKEKSIKLQTIVTGSHLSKFHGSTYKQILKDRINIDQKINFSLKKNNDQLDIANFTGKAISSFAVSYKRLDPDIVVLLGDRYEIFAAAFSAMNMNIPIAHIHGGEKTLGSNDEHMRHAITKMSKWHFVSTLSYQKRVIQLGESPANVYHVGGMAYEAIKKEQLISKKEFETIVKIKLNKNNFLVTFHPETVKNKSNISTFKNMIDALKKIKNSSIIFSLSNADAESGIINNQIEKFVSKNKSQSIYFESMGPKLYYSALKYCNIVIGNSSSGIIEAPYFNTPSINIGDRQNGRISAESVLHSKEDTLSITKSINKAIAMNQKGDHSFYSNPYGKIMSSKKILDVLKKINLKKLNNRKLFYDINQ